MNFPINYSFVTTRTLEISDDGGNEELDVLVLDKKANEAYWKKISSFKATAEKALVEPIEWRISSSFIDMAVKDLVNEESDGENATIFGLHVSVIPDSLNTSPSCVLRLQDNTEIVNDFWK